MQQLAMQLVGKRVLEIVNCKKRWCTFIVKIFQI